MSNPAGGAAGAAESMAHVPHVLVPGPWEGPAIELSSDAVHHLRVVLRMGDSEPCSYTDGHGGGGSGVLEGSRIVRGEERAFPRPAQVTLAVAPPAAKDRLRWIVEKAAEIGVARIVWIDTVHRQGRPPRPDKAAQWAQMALEQSRGHHLTVVDGALTPIGRLEGALVAADQGGGAVERLRAPVTVMVGPEGGWAPDELDRTIPRITLGERVLRTETAAILASYLVLSVAI